MKTSELNGSGPEGAGGAAAPSVMVPVSGPIFGIALANDDLTLAVASGSQILLFDLVDICQRVRVDLHPVQPLRQFLTSDFKFFPSRHHRKPLRAQPSIALHLFATSNSPEIRILCLEFWFLHQKRVEACTFTILQTSPGRHKADPLSVIRSAPSTGPSLASKR
jgi:hypothetical protein